MVDTRRRTSWRILVAGLALVVAIVIAWLLVGPGLSPPGDDDVSRLITEQWVQIYYDRSSPMSRSDGDITIVAFLDRASADCRKLAIALGQLHGLDRGVAGLDIERLRADMKDPPIAKALEENRNLARALDIRSPALIIGERIYRDTTDLKALQVAVAQARSEGPQ